MQDNNKQTAPAAGPPMVFAMPMYHDWVPQFVRPWIYVVLAFCFQFSNGMYLGAMNNVLGEWSVMREDVQMCLYATLIGMAIYFPLLFRMKFRFSNKVLLMTSAAVIALCQVLCTLPLPLPAIWGLCIVCGMAKIQGTFECMSSIQLWMTSKRDFAVFFPLLHIILLTSIEVTAYMAAWFAYDMHWTYMHWFVLALMLFVLAVQAILTRPFHAMPKIVPLSGIDWLGALLWLAFFMQTAWLLNFGDWLDWWHSPTFRLMCGTSLINLAFALQRMFYRPQAFYEPAMWNYRYLVPIVLLIGAVEALFSTEHVLEMVYYEEVMHYADHTSELLNQWSLIGIWAGCLFTLGWLKLMRWNVYKLIAFALGFYCLYVGGFYVLVDEQISIGQLIWPLIFRGFSYSILCISLMWCLHAIMSFQHFFSSAVCLQHSAHVCGRTHWSGAPCSRHQILRGRCLCTLLAICRCRKAERVTHTFPDIHAAVRARRNSTKYQNTFWLVAHYWHILRAAHAPVGHSHGASSNKTYTVVAPCGRWHLAQIPALAAATCKTQNCTISRWSKSK